MIFSIFNNKALEKIKFYVKLVNHKEKIKGDTMKQLDNIYQYYKFLNLSQKQFYQMIEKELNFQETEKINSKQFMKSCQNIIQNYLYDLMLKSETEQLFQIINNYISQHLVIIKNSNNIKQLEKLTFLLQDKDYSVNVELINLLLKKNEKINSILREIVNKNKQIIQKNQIDILTTNPLITYMIECFCQMNSIEIIPLDDSKELEVWMKDTNNNKLNSVLSSYLIAIHKPLLTIEEEKALMNKYLSGDQQAKNVLIERNLRLVVRYARRYYQYTIPLEDLIQEGNVGLIKALDRYDIKKNVKFATYATYWICKSIRDIIHEQSRLIRIPIHHSEAIQKIKRIENEFMNEYGRNPTMKELEKSTGYSEKKIKNLKNIHLEVSSYNVPISDDATDELIELIVSDEITSEEFVVNNSLANAMNQIIMNSNLTETEQLVIKLKYGMDTQQGLSLKQIGEILNVTFQRVQQIEKKAMEKLIFTKEIIKLKDYLDNPEQAIINLEHKKGIILTEQERKRNLNRQRILNKKLKIS